MACVRFVSWGAGVLFVVSLSALPAKAQTTCYVDSVAGDDTKSGLSEEEATQSRTKIASTCTTVKFKRGSVFEVPAGEQIVTMGYSSKLKTLTNYGDPSLPLPKFIKTGSPMYEVLHHYLPKIQRSTVFDRLRLLPREYFVVYVHREENLDSDAQLVKMLHGLTELTSSYGQRVIVSTHPRLRQRIDDRHIELPPKIELAKPMGMTDFVKLQMNARTVLSDSATLTEESSILNFPALNLREAHERPEGFEEGAVMLVGMQWNLIQAALILLAGQMRGPERNLRMVADYNVPNVSEKVVRIILSYTEYVNRTVWQKR